MKKVWNEKNNWGLLEKYKNRQDVEGLVALATTTHDIGIIYEVLQILYQKKELEAIHSLYAIHHQNQQIVRNSLISFYQQKCLEIKQNLAYPITKEQQKLYEQQLGMMIRHTFTVKENNPTYGNLLADLFLKVAGTSALCLHANLLLDNYPEKRNAFKQALIAKNNLMKACNFIQTSATEEDYDLVCYIFQQMEPLYEIIKQDHTVIPKQYAQLEHMMRIIETFVEQKNQQKVKRFETQLLQKEISLFGITKELKKPYTPVLSMIALLPVSETVKETLIMSLDCDDLYKEELLAAYQSKNQRSIQKMDFYYALSQKSILKHQTIFEKEEDKIGLQNRTYLKRIREQKQNGMLRTEDVIGALGEAEPRPVFGLFELIAKELPLEELYALTLNLTFDSAEMRTQMYIYLKNCKELENAYTEEMQNLDILYVKNKMQYKKMLKQKSIGTKKI